MHVFLSPDVELLTARLRLRPSRRPDAERAFEIQSDRAVARMLRMAAFPPNPHEIQEWFAEHERQWLTGEAYRFAVEREGRMIGLVDLDEIAADEGELGYWLERNAWGHGYASEAAREVVRFAFERAGLVRLRSGHAADNVRSGKVLLKLGFQWKDTVRLPSRSRGEDIEQRRYVLERRAS